MTMGMVLVALAIARLAGTGEETTTFGLSRISSAARAGSRSEVAVGEPVLEANIAALDVAEAAQALAKRVDLVLQDGSGPGVKEADERR